MDTDPSGVSDGAQQGTPPAFNTSVPPKNVQRLPFSAGRSHHNTAPGESREGTRGSSETDREHRAGQSAIRLFLRHERPRRNRLVTTSVVGNALAAGFTVGPAFGGTKFTAEVQEALTLEQSAMVWQVLCLAAMLMSVVAAVATSLANSHSVAAKVSAAEAGIAQLGGGGAESGIGPRTPARGGCNSALSAVHNSSSVRGRRGQGDFPAVTTVESEPGVGYRVSPDLDCSIEPMLCLAGWVLCV